jgi:SAM-dependent methyltransferase
MLAVATARGEVLIQADACRLPFGDRTLDAIFAAGLLMHLPDPDAGLRELAREVRPGGRLVLFHPSGRAALAARHGRTIRPDEPLSEQPLRRSTAATGWRLDTYDDADHRFLALATRA